MSNSRKVPVKNRSSSRVGYKIESLRVYRSWRKTGDIVFIPIDELIELKVVVPGGKKLLENYLLIEDEEALSLIFDNIEPEYRYSEKEIEFLLYEGSNEQFLDCLDYAPNGVLELIRSMAIKKQPNTTIKVDAINKKFQINLNRLIENSKDILELENTVVENKRRAAPVVVESSSNTSKYKVVNK